MLAGVKLVDLSFFKLNYFQIECFKTVQTCQWLYFILLLLYRKKKFLLPNPYMESKVIFVNVKNLLSVSVTDLVNIWL